MNWLKKHGAALGCLVVGAGCGIALEVWTGVGRKVAGKLMGGGK